MSLKLTETFSGYTLLENPTPVMPPEVKDAFEDLKHYTPIWYLGDKTMNDGLEHLVVSIHRDELVLMKVLIPSESGFVRSRTCVVSKALSETLNKIFYGAVDNNGSTKYTPLAFIGVEPVGEKTYYALCQAKIADTNTPPYLAVAEIIVHNNKSKLKNLSRVGALGYAFTWLK